MKNQRGMLNAEGRVASVRLSTEPTLHVPYSSFPIRHAVTLIELLITMTIMAIIAAAILGTAAAAIEGAREKRTQTLVNKIHTLLTEHYATYETRRIEIHPDLVASANFGFGGVNANKFRGEALADLRLLGTRELMWSEMPDRWNDVLGSKTTTVLVNPSALARSYQRFYDTVNPSPDNQGAECLYMVVVRATGDGEARTLFSKQDIGDEDGDGAPEFLDGWGKPISWLRWPTGAAPTSVMSGDPVNDHDPLDVYRRDMPGTTHPRPSGSRPSGGSYAYPPRVENSVKLIENRAAGAFRIVPLIFSAGADGDQGFTSKVQGYIADLDPYSAVEPDQAPGGDPPGEDGLLPGGIRDTEINSAKDNITNHLIEY